MLLNMDGTRDIIYTLPNLLEKQKSLTNEILYRHFQEHKPITRPGFNPLVSVVMPVYFEIKNDEERTRTYLKQSVSSIVNQTYSRVEGIIVNDGCGPAETDLLEEVINEAGPKIRYYRKENGGTATALNYGIDRMRGEYFAWLSHDDTYYPNHIETHIDHLRKTLPEEKIVTSSLVRIVDDNSNYMNVGTVFDSMYGKDYKNSLLGRERSYNVTTIGGCSVLIPKAVFDTCGRFEPEAKATHEYELWRRIEAEHRFFTIPIFTHTYRVHSNSEHDRIANLSDIVMGEKIRVIDEAPAEDYLGLYGTEVDFLHAIKDMYYLNCYEHRLVVDYLNQRLSALGSGE
jgi:glycosyltransferase involved in cell wall biosynthesis